MNNENNEVPVVQNELDFDKTKINQYNNNENIITHDINENNNNINNNIIHISEEEDEDNGELTLEELNRIKQIHQETITRTEKYEEFLNDSHIKSTNELIQIPNFSTKNNNNINDDITYENNNFYNNYKINDEVNPNKERKFGCYQIFLFHNDEPLILIGPDIKYYILIVPIVSFFSLCLYSLKNNSTIYNFLYMFAYLFFVISYTILLVKNPGIPTNKNKIDYVELQKNYRQCDVCGCISAKNNKVLTLHCPDCDVCIEKFDHHCPFATKCIGRGNAIFFKIWIVSILVFFLVIFIYLFA